MNDRNKDLFFENKEGEVTAITLTDDAGNTIEAQIIAAMEVEEDGQEYIALLPLEGTEKFPEDQLILLGYSEDEEGNPQYRGISDKTELQEVSEAFMEYLASEAEAENK